MLLCVAPSTDSDERLRNRYCSIRFKAVDGKCRSLGNRGQTPSYAASLDDPTTAPKSDKDEEIVYITRTGTKYHASGCRYLKKSSISIELSKAKARYAACSVCGS